MIWPTWGSCTHSVSLFQNVRYCSVVYLAVLLVFFCLFACLLWKLGNTNSQQNGLLAVWAVLKMSLLIIDFSWAAAHALLWQHHSEFSARCVPGAACSGRWLEIRAGASCRASHCTPRPCAPSVLSCLGNFGLGCTTEVLLSWLFQILLSAHT